MIRLRAEEGTTLPSYKTEFSSGADLRSTQSIVVPPLGHAKVRTGVYIESVEWSLVPKGFIPELQIRARSGLAAKHGIGLSNGVGTVDADYPDEICVLMWNSSETEFKIEVGDRIAQLVLNLVPRIPNLLAGGKRIGGFGSTGL